MCAQNSYRPCTHFASCTDYRWNNGIFAGHFKLFECIEIESSRFFSVDLDAKNIQSGRGPRSDSDLLKWDNEINTFDDDYEGNHAWTFFIHTHTRIHTDQKIYIDPIRVDPQCRNLHTDTIWSDHFSVFHESRELDALTLEWIHRRQSNEAVPVAVLACGSDPV